MTPNGRRRGLAVIAGGASILSFYAALVILNTWFLVPNDPSQTQAHNFETKLKITAVCAIVLVILILFIRWILRKRDELAT